MNRRKFLAASAFAALFPLRALKRAAPPSFDASAMNLSPVGGWQDFPEDTIIVTFYQDFTLLPTHACGPRLNLNLPRAHWRKA